MDELSLSLSDLARAKPDAVEAIVQALVGAALALDSAARFGPGNALHAALVSLRADLLAALPGDDLMDTLAAISELDGRVGTWPRDELLAREWFRKFAALAGEMQGAQR